MTTSQPPSQLLAQAIDKLIEERVKLAILDITEEDSPKRVRDQQKAVVESAKAGLQTALQNSFQDVFESLKTMVRR